MRCGRRGTTPRGGTPSASAPRQTEGRQRDPGRGRDGAVLLRGLHRQGGNVAVLRGESQGFFFQKCSSKIDASCATASTILVDDAALPWAPAMMDTYGVHGPGLTSMGS